MLTLVGSLLLPRSAALATDGHFLHGIGAINSAMGGVGVAASSSILGAFYVNPAGLLAFPGTATELGFELFKPTRSLSSRAGPASGSTSSGSQFVPIPAFGWSRELVAEALVVGVAGLGVGGFGVDYPVDAANPLLSPRPNGFGEIYSNFSLMKIIPAVAYRLTPRLRLGAALNIDWASLAVDPMAVAAPAVDPGPDGTPGTADDRAYYSRATDAYGSFGIGAQVGLQYAVTPTIALGLAYTTPQKFHQFEYDAVYENPNLPSYNTPRTIRFAMDVPAVYAAGVAWIPGRTTSFGLDGKYITYASTRGFRESGFAADGAVKGFGWKSIWSVASGAQYRPTDQAALRVGYNYSGNPIPPELTMFNAPAPAVVQHHLTLGAGYMFDGFGVDVGYYHAFRNTITGPFQTLAGAAPGTSVSSSLAESSFLIGVTYGPRRSDRRASPGRE
jgi:long-chain fatty acid transport protein